MLKYKCIVADDNLLERDALTMFLEMTNKVDIVASCEDGIQARNALLNDDIDIVFSDIDMPNLSGLDLLKSLKKTPEFVFITSYPEYAAKSYELDAIDFIVKPATFDRVARSVDKVIEYIELKKLSQNQLDHVSVKPNELQTSATDYFFIRETPDLVKIKFSEVSYIESMGEFSKIFTTGGKKHITLVSLKNLELQLPTDVFMRTHKQYIINYTNITSIGNNEVTLNHTNKIPVSLLNKPLLLDKVVNNNILNRYVDKAD
jgi:two-component system LytT family response regulator